jgi:hypothetical protein
MEIRYAVSEYPTLLENMVAKVYESQSPFAEVGSITIPERDGSGTPTVGAGHQVPFTVNFTGLDKFPHIVRLFTASGTKLHQYSIQPTENIVSVFDPVYFRVGDGGSGTPVAGQPLYVNAIFAGVTSSDIEIWQEGLGFLLPEIDYELAGTTVTLLNTNVFEEGQRWYIKRKTIIVTNPVNDSVVSKGFGGFLDVTANINYDPAHLRKLIRFSGSIGYTFPMGADIPIGYNHTFTNFGIEAGMPAINFSNGTLLYGSIPRSFLILPFSSTGTFTWDGTNWNVIQLDIVGASAGPISGDIVGQGSSYLGDILGPDQNYTITHGLGITYGYKVFATLRGTDTSKRFDNDCTWALHSYTSSGFKLTIQERNGGIQNLTLDYVLIKS